MSKSSLSHCISLILNKLVLEAFVTSVAKILPFVNFQINQVSIVPKQTCPFLAFFLTPSTLSKIQAIFVAEKYGSRSSPVFLFIISSSPSFFKLLHNSDVLLSCQTIAL